MNCPYCLKFTTDTTRSGSQIQAGEKSKPTIKIGFFFRDFDRSVIQRFRCFRCRKTFSFETTQPCKYQKKRHLNKDVFCLLVSGVSQRRASRLLATNRKTVARKFRFLGKHSLLAIQNQKAALKHKVETLLFDDVETFEHTKCKPLSIALAVEDKTRFILGFKVASMPAKGLLVAKAFKKYGVRKDERSLARKELFKELRDHIDGSATIKSDENPHYINDVKNYFPTCVHKSYKGRRGCVIGQGELKSGGFDPLFSLNHTAAMLRANINRLFRRTWNTTKKPSCLEHHIAMYAVYHNQLLI